MPTGTQDAENIRLWEGCVIYYADKGTAPPTDVTTALAAEWFDGGLVVTDDGGQQEVDVESNVIQARGKVGVFPARKTKRVNSRKLTVVFMEDNWNVLQLVEPTTTRVSVGGVTTVTHRQWSGPNEKALVIERWDGEDLQSRFVITRGDVTETQVPRLYGSDPSYRAVEIEIFSQGDGTYATEITNDPAMVAP